VVSYAWVAGPGAALLAVIALTELWTARRERRAMLRKPPHDPRGDARRQAEGPPVPTDQELGQGGSNFGRAPPFVNQAAGPDEGLLGDKGAG